MEEFTTLEVLISSNIKNLHFIFNAQVTILTKGGASDVVALTEITPRGTCTFNGRCETFDVFDARKPLKDVNLTKF